MTDKKILCNIIEKLLKQQTLPITIRTYISDVRIVNYTLDGDDMLLHMEISLDNNTIDTDIDTCVIKMYTHQIEEIYQILDELLICEELKNKT